MSNYNKSFIVILIVAGSALILGGLYTTYFGESSAGLTPKPYSYGMSKGTINNKALFLFGGVFISPALFLRFFEK